MKKLIILTLFILGISSCTEQATYKKSMLNTEITDKQLHKEFDTLLVVKESSEYHIFDNKTNNYVESTHSSPNSLGLSMLIFGIFLGILLGCLMFL